MQTNAELDTESWSRTTSRTSEPGRSLCHFNRLPCRRRYCYRYPVRLFCPYCLGQLLCLYCSRSIPLLGLCRPTVLTNCATATATAVPTSYSTAAPQPFRSAVPIILPLLSQLTATDRLLPTVPLLLSKVLLLDVLLPTNCYQVLLQSVLPTTVPFYPTAPTLCFFYYYYYRYYYCCYCCYYCYCCYCYRYYFWFPTDLVATSGKVRSQLWVIEGHRRTVLQKSWG